MEVPRGIRRQADSIVYDSEEVRSVLEELGIDIRSETESNFMCLCPFHSNTYSPAFTVSKESGLFICFNAACNMRGNLLQLITLLTDKTDGEARRMIKKLPDVPLSDLLDKALVEDKVHEIPQMVVDGFIDQLNQRAIDYLSGRGFDKETIEYFEVGYDSDNDFIVVPIRNHKQQIVGLNGRSIEGKRFKISKKTHRNKILFNINNAKKYGTAIVCESQFDVMRLHQAGFPNGICPMGSHVSDDQFHMMSRYFTRVIIATDADAAGRSMGMKISNKLHHRVIEWAVDDVNKRSIYPNKAKDIGDLTDSEIQKVIQNSVTDWEYRLSGMV